MITKLVSGKRFNVPEELKRSSFAIEGVARGCFVEPQLVDGEFLLIAGMYHSVSQVTKYFSDSAVDTLLA